MTRLEILGLMAGGCILETAPDGTYLLGGEEVCPESVDRLKRDGHIHETRVPVVSGTSRTGRHFITKMGERYVELARRAA